MPELLPSPAAAPPGALMLPRSCLASHSSPKPRKAGENNIKAALHDPPPTAAFHPMLILHLNLASGRFMFITEKAAKQIE